MASSRRLYNLSTMINRVRIRYLEFEEGKHDSDGTLPLHGWWWSDGGAKTFKAIHHAMRRTCRVCV